VAGLLNISAVFGPDVVFLDVYSVCKSNYSGHVEAIVLQLLNIRRAKFIESKFCCDPHHDFVAASVRLMPSIFYFIG
jgi:hypothetical protein